MSQLSTVTVQVAYGAVLLTAALGLLFLHRHFLRRALIVAWGGAFAIHAIGQLLAIGTEPPYPDLALVLLRFFAAQISGGLILAGAALHVARPGWARGAAIVTGLAMVLFTIGMVIELPREIRAIPIALGAGGTLLAAAWLLWRYERDSAGRQLCLWALVIWGLGRTSFPLLLDIPSVWLWGYLVGNGSAFLVLTGAVILVLEELRQRNDHSAKLTSAILDHMDQGVLLVDAQAQVIASNALALGMLDLPDTLETADLDLGLIYHQLAGAGLTPQDLYRRDLAGEVYVEEVPINGRIIEHRHRPLPDGGWIDMFSDVTARRANEALISDQKNRLEDLNRQKDRVIGIIGHDLRGPFSALLGLSELLNEDLEHLNQTDIREMAHNIHVSGQMIQHLLDTLLDWTRIRRRDSQEKRAEHINLAAEVANVLQLLGPMASAKGVTLVAGTGLTDLPMLTGDHQLLATLLRNTVSNAIKFAHADGSVTVTAALSGSNLELTVADSGIGMTEDQIARLMGGTQSTGPTAGTKGEPGTGLGLLLCRELLERRGGHITIRSQIGRGTQVTITVPLA